MMKATSVLNVLMYLFRHHLHEQFETDNTQQKLLPQLEKAGFERNAIYYAFDWLNQLGEQEATSFHHSPSEAIRLYDPEEQELLDTECRGFITTLEQYGILKPHIREKVINQTLALEEEGIDIHLIKWVTLLVLFTQPNEENALNYMEHLVLNEPTTTLQ